MPTCPPLPASNSTEPVFHGATFHGIASAISAVFTLFTCIIALFLFFKHATHYTKPYEQRYILRIIGVLPAYSISSFLSISFYSAAQYVKILGDLYEAFAVASFYLLILSYIAVDKWSWFQQLNSWTPGRRMTEGKGNNRKFHMAWVFIFQYPLTKTLLTIVQEITQATGRYCETSNSPAFAKFWIQIPGGALVGLAVGTILKVLNLKKQEMVEHSPYQKFIALKLIVLLNVVQTVLFSFLISGNQIKPGKQLSYNDLSIGIPTLLINFEMFLFSLFFLFAYPSKPYRTNLSAESGLSKPHEHPGFFAAVVQCFNPMDVVHCVAWCVPLAQACFRNDYPPADNDSASAELNPVSHETAYAPVNQVPASYGHDQATYGQPQQYGRSDASYAKPVDEQYEDMPPPESYSPTRSQHYAGAPYQSYGQGPR